MIQFRCWYCNRRYSVSERRAGARIPCSCKNLLRVPRRSGGNCRVRTPVDWLVEAVVYGGGGALLGFGLAVLFLSQLLRPGLGMPRVRYSWLLVGGLTLAGFLFGLLGGERGINCLGRMIRNLDPGHNGVDVD